MGAAASVRMIYSQAQSWLKTYFGSEAYAEDFNAIDKDHDGGITFGELQKWILAKAAANPEGGWALFKDHPQVMQIAHKSAGMGIDSRSSSHAGKVVDVAEFRLLLMHLFAVSILLAHFEHADDMGSKQLGFEEFTMAVKTFCETHAHEQLTVDQLQEDFDLLDTNKSNTIGFVEVCSFCCKFIDPSFLNEDPSAAPKLDQKTSKILGIDKGSVMVNDRADFTTDDPSPEKSSDAFRGLKDMLEHEMEDADRILEGREFGDEGSTTLGGDGSNTGEAQALSDTLPTIETVTGDL